MANDPVSSNGRPPIESVLPSYFGFGVSSYGGVLEWPGQVKTSHGIQWNFLYWYMLMGASDWYLETKLQRAHDLGAIPVITHYQLLERGKLAGYTGANEWDIVIQAVQDNTVMNQYFQNVKWIMGICATFGEPVIFQTEPDSTTWLRMFHTGGTNDANNGYVAVAASGHADLADLPNTIAGYAQALIRLRDRYAPNNVYMGLCEFDNRNGQNPGYSVKFIQSMNTQWDILFTHHVIKYSTRDCGWWNAFSRTAQDRFLTWINTITSATGLKYIHWQAVIGAMDYGLMPDYPTHERISDLVAAGSAACLFDLQTLNGPPHSTPHHGFTCSPPVNHPAYNSLERLAERLQLYYQGPIPLRRPDLDGDGVPDILWRNHSTGENAIWYMQNQGKSIKSSAWAPSAATAWVVGGIEDFDDDGAPDILWRDPDTGKNAIWYMQNSGRSVRSSAWAPSAATAWVVGGVADFDNDGAPDILWRNPGTGKNAIWYMRSNVASVKSSTWVPTVTADWVVGKIADFDGDGVPDILWRDPDTGKNAIWYMRSNGASVRSSAWAPNADTSWEIGG